MGQKTTLKILPLIKYNEKSLENKFEARTTVHVII